MRAQLYTIVAILVATIISLGATDCEGEFPSGVNPAPSPGSTSATSAVTIRIPPNAAGLGASAFGANPLTIQSGTQVTWINDDTTTHSIVASSGSFQSPEIPPGGIFTQLFSDLGTFGYYCGVHGPTSESGVIIVTASAAPNPTPTNSGLPTVPVPVPGPVETPFGFPQPVPQPGPTFTAPPPPGTPPPGG